MIAKPSRLQVSAAAITLALSLPLAAQDAAGGFVLPQPSPTPSPAPAGPDDERAGVAIPPKAPSKAPAPPPIEAAPSASPAPAPLDLPLPPPTARRVPQAPANAPPTAVSGANPPVATEAAPLDLPSAVPAPPPLPAPTSSASAASAVQGIPADLPPWWPWAAGGLGGLCALAASLVVWRRKRPKVLRLAAPVPNLADDTPAADLARIDIALEITGATRSLMMFTIQYRLLITNRTDRAVRDVSIAVQIASAQHGAGNAASPGAAQKLVSVDRIGPHQGRSITAEVQLAINEIAIMRQGRTAVFIPLVHVTLEGQGQTALTRSFVVGSPSVGGTGRLHPILLDSPPGSIAGLTAQPITIPAISAAA